MLAFSTDELPSPPITQMARDLHFLNRLRDYFAENRAFPSYQKLAAHLGLSSKSAVKKVLDRLSAHRFLTRNGDGHWIPGERFFERTLSQTAVMAGPPGMADDLTGDPFTIDQWFVRKPSSTFLLPIKGDSMVDAGICEGDIAVVERQSKAESGQLVVALVDGEWTLKTLALEGKDYFLLPANRAYSPIRSRETLQICGIVVGLMRRYGR